MIAHKKNNIMVMMMTMRLLLMMMMIMLWKLVSDCMDYNVYSRAHLSRSHSFGAMGIAIP